MPSKKKSEQKTEKLSRRLDIRVTESMYLRLSEGCRVTRRDVGTAVRDILDATMEAYFVACIDQQTGEGKRLRSLLEERLQIHRSKGFKFFL